MKQLFAFFITLITISLPALGQWQQHPQLSPDDQRRFDSYFSRWQEYRRTNNRDEMNSMEKRMQDIYVHYNIPSNTPYFAIASNSRDEDWDRWDRRERWRERFSEDDQRRFDSYYSRWLDYRRDNNQSEVNSMERRMWDVMDQYKIPRDVSFDEIASGQRY